MDMLNQARNSESNTSGGWSAGLKSAAENRGAGTKKKTKRRDSGFLRKDTRSFVKEAPYIMLRGDLNKTSGSEAALKIKCGRNHW